MIRAATAARIFFGNKGEDQASALRKLDRSVITYPFIKNLDSFNVMRFFRKIDEALVHNSPHDN